MIEKEKYTTDFESKLNEFVEDLKNMYLQIQANGQLKDLLIYIKYLYNIF